MGVLVIGCWQSIGCRGVGGGSQLGGVWILSKGGLGRIFGGCLGRFEVLVLNTLELEYVGGRGVGEPGGGSICEDRMDEGHVGIRNSFLYMAPGGTS